MGSRVLKSLVYFADDRGESLFDLFPETIGVGQVNVSRIDKGVVKAFHLHRNQNDYVICLSGRFRLLTAAEDGTDFNEHILSSRNPQVIEIDKDTYHGYQALEENSVILYYCDNRYDMDNPDEYRGSWEMFGKEVWDINYK